MAVDLKIELFSADLFRSLWYHACITDFVFPKLHGRNVAYNEYASYAVVNAVLCRQAFFQQTLRDVLNEDYNLYSNSAIEFYLYLQNNMTKFIAYNELNIFEKLFMSCAVALIMSYKCSVKNNEIYLTCAPLCWAMYFDTECKYEFYDKGGWTKLEQCADSYNTEISVSRYENFYRGKCKCNSDFLNARERFELLSNEYSMPKLLSVFKNKILKGKSRTSCPECLPLFYAVSAISGGSDDTTELQFNECYLQILKLMLSHEEMLQSEEEILQDPELKEISEIISVVRNPSKDSNHELFGNKVAFYEKFDVFKERYGALNTTKLLNLIFIAESDLDEGQCIFCSRNINDPLESHLLASDPLVERIKSTVSAIAIVVGEKSEELQKVPCENYKSRRLHQKKDGIDEVLRLFFTLGVQPATFKILENFRKRNNEKNREKSTDLFASPHIQSAAEVEIKGAKQKQRRKKNKKFFKS